MYVDVAFAVVGGTDVTVAAIPSTAVQFLNNQQVVFVPTNENNVFAMRVVRLGPQVNGFYSVLDGLRVGESVVTEGSFMLRAEWAKTHTGGAGMQM
jgi:cobalt-zinc-cadmium efflux system membrane fusion protein